MAAMVRAALASLVLASAADALIETPSIPKEYEAVIQLRMPYIPMDMPLRVLTTGSEQMVEYYDGLQTTWSSKDGIFKRSFNNSRRQCTWSAPPAGPTLEGELAAQAGGDAWSAMPFLPDLSQYKRVDDELVGGILCHRYRLDTKHGETGTMDDHLSFYWDPVLGKPVRWHMHSREVTFGSHTDEYIMDYLSFTLGAPSASSLARPAECKKPQVGRVSLQLQQFLEAAQALQVPTSASADASAFLQPRGRSYVQELNERHDGRATFRSNQFSGMTKDEVMSFKGGRAGRGITREHRRTEEHRQLVRMFETQEGASPPTNFDWRTAMPGSVSPVKDQANCGSCWTYGLTEPIESIRAIKTGGRLVELPEQFVVDCTWTYSNASVNAGCDGGNSDVGALEIVRRFGGVVPTAESYGSYMSVNGYCKDIRLMDVGARITGWVDIQKRHEQGLLQALVSEGPISVGIQVPDEMLYYESGVLSVESCRHNEAAIDHAVTMTGFGTDAHGTTFYTIRNSWSTYWGNQGYINIARGELDCCVSCEAGYPQVATAGETLVV